MLHETLGRIDGRDVESEFDVQKQAISGWQVEIGIGSMPNSKLGFHSIREHRRRQPVKSEPQRVQSIEKPMPIDTE